MTYELQIVLRRDDPDELAGDFSAVTQLLEKRRRKSTTQPRRLHAVES